MPPFAAFWEGLDLADRVDLGLLDDAGAMEESRVRERAKRGLVRFLARRGHLASNPRDAEAILRAWLGFLAASEARVILVNLEDLWLETKPQNVPGTTSERPNWRRRIERDLDAFAADQTITSVLRGLDRLRRKRR